MQRVQLKKTINIDQLPYPGVNITYDLIGRVTEYYFDYKSIRVTYNSIWVGDTNQLFTLTQSIQDKP